MKKIIATGKGGVGKTTTLTTISLLMAREGKRVIVFDTDKLDASGEHKVKRFIDERTSTAEAKEVMHEAEEHAAHKQ